MNGKTVVGLVGLAAFWGGCATVAPPNEKLASSQAAIRGAEEVGARGVPQAALHLKLAQEQVAQAKSLMKEGDGERASLTLARAQIDAELALALTREYQGRLAAQHAMQQAQSLSQQIR